MSPCHGLGVGLRGSVCSGGYHRTTLRAYQPLACSPGTRCHRPPRTEGRERPNREAPLGAGAGQQAGGLNWGSRRRDVSHTCLPEPEELMRGRNRVSGGCGNGSGLRPQVAPETQKSSDANTHTKARGRGGAPDCPGPVRGSVGRLALRGPPPPQRLAA